ncbi:immunoglobulin-like domain-containing protein [Macrococcoides bohemicum]|uniref:immunoglobulin-like domain-containing protein n=1 Tax=Macrococcoides bohemicum TaxID=1903056 RepID=UPI003B0044B6
MKVSKLYSTSIAAALLSTTILTGVASANTTQTTQPSTGTTTTTPALTAEQTAAKAELDTVIKRAEETVAAYAKDTTMKFDPTYLALRRGVDAAKLVSGNAASKVEEYNKAKTDLDAKLSAVIVVQERRNAEDRLEKSIAEAIVVQKKADTRLKPMQLQTNFTKELSASLNLRKKLAKAADVDAQNEKLKAATKAVSEAGTVVKIPLKDATTVKFTTADGRTSFPLSAGKLVSSGSVSPAKDTDYIEVNTLRDLTKYGLNLPKGFEFGNPDKPIKEVADFEKVELKQTPGFQFSEALVTFTLKRDGQVIDSAIPNFTVLQETNFENKYSEVMDKLTADQLKDIKTYYLKEGYIVAPSTTKYTFNKESFYQTAEINFIKKPEAPPAPVVVDGPGMSSFNGYQFKAGQKYTLPAYVELYEDPKSNIQMNNKDFNIKVMSVTPVGNKKKLPVVDNKVTFTKPGNYTVKFAIYDKDGHRLKDYKGKERNFLYVSNTATVVDSAPVISGVKSTTYSKKTFSYTKGIKAYDYVDKKYVKVTYKGKVNPSKKGKYKIYYSATDSKGNTAKKTRYVVVK